MTKFNISILQMDIIWANPDENRKHAAHLIESAPGADLYLIPEMFTTGFATEPEGIAECTTDTLEWMKSMASLKNAAIAGSVSLKEDGKFYNRFYFVKPDGTYVSYDKKHLFTFSGEHLRYTAGRHKTIVEWRGVRFQLLVCYDLRFPVWARNTGNYDVILYVASWPIQRIEAWKTLIRARAIENQSYVAAANRYGDDPGNHYSGASALIDPYGHTVEEIEEKEGVISAVIDLDLLCAFRAKFPVINDADAHELK